MNDGGRDIASGATRFVKEFKAKAEGNCFSIRVLPRLAGTRAAVLVNIGVIEPLADLRVGRFRIRTFDDVTEVADWLHPDAV